MRRCRGQRGQTAAEYLGVLFFVLALILVFAATDFPGRVGHAVGREICLTINRARDCDAPPPRATRKLLSEAPEPGGGPPVAPSVGEGGSGNGRGGGVGLGVWETRFLPDGAGWVQLRTADGLGRASKVEFVVNEDAMRVPRANRVVTPKGFARVEAWAESHGIRLDRTHLMPNELGGPGDDEANFIIAPRNFNRSKMRTWENTFKKLIRQGETIHVKETPIYKGRELVPRSVQIDIWRQTAQGREEYVTGACLNVWPGEPPPGIPTG